MKTFRINKLLCLALLITCFCACSDDKETYKAVVLEGNQIYFSNSLNSTVELEKAESSFNVVVHRSNTTGSVSVNLTVSDSSDKFTIPNTVTFADGSEVANLNIVYDPDALDYDEYADISLSLADDNFSTPYGDSSYSFKAGIPAPWNSLGSANFFDSWYYSGAFNVEIQQHTLFPTRYRLVSPYRAGDNLEFQILPAGSVYLGITTTIDGLVIFSDFYVFYSTTNAGDVYGLHPSRFTNFSTESSWTYSIVKQTSADGSPEVVQLAPYYYIFGLGGWNQTQADGVVTIIFPGAVMADYSAELTYLGRFTDVDDIDHAAAYLTLGGDVSSAKVALVETANAGTAVDAIIDGSLESLEVHESGRVELPCEVTGNYTFVAVTYSSDGESKESASVSFKFTSSHDNAETWKSLGMTDYTDDYLAPAYKADPITYQVEIQQSEQNPGKFRLVNPYGEAYPYNESGDWDTSKDYYMIINATDPQGVYIELQDMGVDWGNGKFYVYSFAAYYMDLGETLEQAKARGVCGTYADGVILFPISSLLCSFEGNSSLYYANSNEQFKVIIPDESIQSPVKVAAKSSSYQPRGRKMVSSPIDKKLIMPMTKNMSLIY